MGIKIYIRSITRRKTSEKKALPDVNKRHLLHSHNKFQDRLNDYETQFTLLNYLQKTINYTFAFVDSLFGAVWMNISRHIN